MLAVVVRPLPEMLAFFFRIFERFSVGIRIFAFFRNLY